MCWSTWSARTKDQCWFACCSYSVKLLALKSFPHLVPSRTMSSFQEIDFSLLKWETADIAAGWIQGNDMPPNKKWHVLGKYQVDRMVNGSYHRIYSPSEWGGMLEMALVNSWVDSTGDVYMQYSRCLDHDLDGVLVRGIKPRAIVTFTLYVCKRLCFVCYIL